MPSLKALIVGVEFYEHFTQLSGCVNDADAVERVLKFHGDARQTRNFDTVKLIASTSDEAVRRSDLRESIKELFSGTHEIALFYFAGHGHIESTGGYILASDSDDGDDGVPISDIITWANNSKSTNRIIVLDSCFSGAAGSSATHTEFANIKEGTTILTASEKDQYAMENNGAGLFTSLFVDALEGAAANLVGEITPGSVYAHIDQSLGSWQQRPIFKTNVRKFVSLRTVEPPISLPELRRLTEFFVSSEDEFDLDPTFEPERGAADESIPPPDPENNEKFAVLQKFNRINLVVPVDAPHMWHAAMQEKSCRLTALGRHYHRLVTDERI